MKYRHRAGSYLGGAILSLLFLPSARAEPGFNVIPESDATSFETDASDDSREKRRNDDVLWGIAGAGVAGAFLLNGGGSQSGIALTRTDPTGTAESGPYFEAHSGKTRDGGYGITATPEPASLALIAGGALPLFGLLRRRR